MTLKNYIRNKKVSNFTWNGIEVFIKDDFLNADISIHSVLREVEDSVTKYFLSTLDAIYVGQFDLLKKRSLVAYFDSRAIYVTNEQDNDVDMVDDIIHEIGHAVEEENRNLIYGDGKVEKEFLQKRKELWSLLSTEGYSLNLQYFLQPEYDERFDSFLYNDVGYPTLSAMTVNLYCSPYGATSLREYYANGFECLFHDRDTQRVKSLSPRLYEKLLLLLEKSEEYENDREN